MKKYQVEVAETLARIIEVSAESEAEAIEKVEQMYYDSAIVLDSNDMDGDAQFQIIEDAEDII